MAWLSELDRPDQNLSGMSPPTTDPLLGCKCEGENCFLCISYSSIMAYIHILTTCNSQKIATVPAKHVLPWRKTQDKVLFKSGCIRAKYFTGLVKKQKHKAVQNTPTSHRICCYAETKHSLFGRHHHTQRRRTRGIRTRNPAPPHSPALLLRELCEQSQKHTVGVSRLAKYLHSPPFISGLLGKRQE